MKHRRNNPDADLEAMLAVIPPDFYGDVMMLDPMLKGSRAWMVNHGLAERDGRKLKITELGRRFSRFLTERHQRILTAMRRTPEEKAKEERETLEAMRRFSEPRRQPVRRRA